MQIGKKFSSHTSRPIETRLWAYIEAVASRTAASDAIEGAMKSVVRSGLLAGSIAAARVIVPAI